MGMGHLMQIKALAQHFLESEHHVFLALQDVRRAPQVFSGMNVTILQAPIAHSLYRAEKQAVDAYGQLLLINGYHDSEQILGLCQSWQTLYDLIQPKLIIFDHSPTAMLAARGVNAITVTVGTSFTVPPVSTPLAMWRDNNKKQAQLDEQKVLAVCNNVLSIMVKPKMQALHELYSDIDHQAIMSLPEFDHISLPKNTRHLGSIKHHSSTVIPNWPPVKSHKKLYVYVKPFKHLPALLAKLMSLDASIIVYSGDIPEHIIKPYQARHICYEAKPLNLEQISQQASAVIINANHGTLMHFVLSKVPVMMLPLQQEQQLLAKRMQSQGIGLHASLLDSQHMLQCVDTLLNIKQCSKAMSKLADTYQNFNAEQKQKEFFQSLLQQLKS